MKHAVPDIRPQYEDFLSHDVKLSDVDWDLKPSLKALYIWVNVGENHPTECWKR